MNDGAVLINYDRGEVVDASALAAALDSGKIRHAGIDADLFRNPQTGELSGPMVPYLPLLEKRKGLFPVWFRPAQRCSYPLVFPGFQKGKVVETSPKSLNRQSVHLDRPPPLSH